MIYIVASTLGGPWALLASAVGAALADLSSPYAIYAPVSIIVKVLIALPFVLVNKKSEKILTPLTICLTIPSGIITVGGYFVGDLIINKAYAVADIPMNIVQAVGSAIILQSLHLRLILQSLKRNCLEIKESDYMADIVYTLDGDVYLNITNKCPCNCAFCIRTKCDAYGDSEELWFDTEPTFEEIKMQLTLMIFIM